MILNSLRKHKAKKEIMNQFNPDTFAIKYITNGKFIMNKDLRDNVENEVIIRFIDDNVFFITNNFDVIDVKTKPNYITKKGEFTNSILAKRLNVTTDEIFELEPFTYDNEGQLLEIGYYLTTNKNNLETNNN